MATPSIDKTKILIIEDDRDLLADMVIFLTRRFCVYTAASSTEAMRVYQKVHPNCCIIDVNLPSQLSTDNATEGISLAADFLKRSEEKPAIIFISRDPLPVDNTVTRQFPFIRKPFQINQLVQTIDQQI